MGVLGSQRNETSVSCLCSKSIKREIKRSQVDEDQNVILTPDKSNFGWYNLEYHNKELPNTPCAQVRSWTCVLEGNMESTEQTCVMRITAITLLKKNGFYLLS